MNQTAMKLIWMLFAVQLLVGCHPGGAGSSKGRLGAPFSNPGKSPGGGDPTSPAGRGNAHGEGPIDGGGGNGFDHKVMASYIVDPTSLEAYEKVTKLILMKFADPKDPNGENLKILFGMKTWYLAPVELNRLENDQLGVSFVKNSSQQLARQSLKEIWIDRNLFEKMTLQEQGKLILHELVMSYYMWRFEKMSEFCRLTIARQEKSDSDKPIDCDGPAMQEMDRMKPAERPRPLNEEDNQRIRSAEGEILSAQGPATSQDLARIFLKNGFDPRFFETEEPEGSDSVSTEEKTLFTSEDVSQALAAGTMTRYQITTCYDPVDKSERSCAFKYQAVPGLASNRFKFELSIEGNPPIVFEGFLLSRYESTGSREKGRNTVYSIPVQTTDWSRPGKVGEEFWNVVLFIERKDDLLSKKLNLLTGISVKRSVLYAKDGKDCSFEEVARRGPFQTNVLATSEENPAGMVEALIHRMTPPWGFCEAL